MSSSWRMLRCPRDSSPLEEVDEGLRCPSCSCTFPVVDGVPDLLVDEPGNELDNYFRRWRTKSIEDPNTNDYARAQRGTFLERTFHNRRLASYRRLMTKATQGRELGLVVDLGFGTGYTIDIHPPCERLIGLEISRDNIATCRKNMGERCPSLVRGDVYSLPFDDGSVDMLSMFYVFHRLQQDMLMREVKRVLRPGGVFVFTAPWHYAYLWNQGIRRLFHRIGIFSDSPEMRISFDVPILRFRTSDVRFLAYEVPGIRCKEAYVVPSLMEIHVVFVREDKPETCKCPG